MEKIQTWVKERIKERTSLDGVALIGVGAVILFLEPIAKLAAFGAIVYGAYTLIKRG